MIQRLNITKTIISFSLIIKAFANSKRSKSVELSDFNVGGLLKGIIVANGLIKNLSQC